MPREFWNTRYAAAGYVYGTEPNAFLVSQAHRLVRGGKALAVADGEGRNGVWLAQQGLEVLSVDASDVGLRKARELAQSRGVSSITTVQADLTTWAWPCERFDVVVAIFAHFPPDQRPRLHAAMYDALKPGGLLLLEAFTPQQLELKTGGPSRKEMLYTVTTLRGDFPHGDIALLEERVTDLAEGEFHRGSAAVIRLVLRKPAA
jgi:SAM-dependent methyltransferase